MQKRVLIINLIFIVFVLLILSMKVSNDANQMYRITESDN